MSRSLSLSCLLVLVLGFTLVAQGTADASKYSQSVQLKYEILGTSNSIPQPLAEISYEPSTSKSTLVSWTPPSAESLKSSSVDPQSQVLVRVSTPDGSSTVTTLASFDSSVSQYIDLWVSSSAGGEVISANISPVSPPPLTDEEKRQKRKEERAKAKGKPLPSAKPVKKPKAKKAQDSTATVLEEQPSGPVVKVNIYKAGPGPIPNLLTRPKPLVDSEGREVPAVEVAEKSFFQKYWWILLAVMFLLVGSGGDGK